MFIVLLFVFMYSLRQDLYDKPERSRYLQSESAYDILIKM